MARSESPPIPPAARKRYVVGSIDACGCDASKKKHRRSIEECGDARRYVLVQRRAVFLEPQSDRLTMSPHT